jgi:N4-gp56 family major capsid protein
MATTEYGVNHPSAVKLWSEKLFREALKDTWMSKFMGKGSDSMIQILTNTQKGAGDRITASLRMQLTGDGVEGDATAEGNEEALTTYTDNILINQLRHSVRSAGKMSEQRVPWKYREDAMMGLKDWWADRFDTALINQLTGNTLVSDTKKTGHNATVAPDTAHIMYPEAQTTEAGVASKSASASMKLTWIDYAVEKIKTSAPLVRPLKIKGESMYAMFLHPYQVTSLRTNTNTGQWLDIQKAAMQGGKLSDNPIFTGALGVYNNVILHESTRIPAVHAAASTGNVYRAVICGAQSGMLAFGQGYDGDASQKWYEELFDYGNQLGVSAGMIWGAKKARFNSADFGTMVVPTWEIAKG